MATRNKIARGAAATQTPPRKPKQYLAVKKLGSARGGGLTAEELGIEEVGMPGEDEFSREPRGKPGIAAGTTIFPDPGGFKLGWDKFRRYWQMLWDDPKYRSRLAVYCYRTWPYMLEGHRQVFKLVGLPDESEPDAIAKPMTIQEILHRFGSGSYHLKINDAGARTKQICHCHVDKAELRDPEHPPVLNLDHLDPAHPSNATFIKRQKERGGYGNEEDRMKEFLELTKMALDAKDAAAKTGGGGDEAARVVAHAAEAGMDIIASAAKRAGQPSEQRPDNTMQSLEAAVKLLSNLRQDNGGSKEVMDILRLSMDAERNAHKTQVEALMTTLNTTVASLQAQQQQAAQQQQNPPSREGVSESSSLVKRMEEMVLVKELMGKLAGRGGGSVSPWMEMAPMMIQTAAPLINAISTGLLSWATGQGGRAAQNQQGQSQPGVGQPQQAQTGSLPPEAAAALDQMLPPFLRMLDDPDRDGADFADFFIDWQGEESYRQLVGLGPEAIHAMIVNYPPAAGNIRGKEEALLRFLFEFIDAAHQDEEGEDQGDGEPGRGMAQGGDVGGFDPNAAPGPPVMPPWMMGEQPESGEEQQQQGEAAQPETMEAELVEPEQAAGPAEPEPRAPEKKPKAAKAKARAVKKAAQ